MHGLETIRKLNAYKASFGMMLNAMRDAHWMVEQHKGTSDENDAIVDAYAAAIKAAEEARNG